MREPGVHQLTDEEYFAGPLARASLSSTGVRELLVCPAKFRHNQLHPRAPKKAFDVGHAAHQLVLGAGPELVRIDADEWRTNAIKAEVQSVRDRGAVPLKPADWDAVHAMAAALQSHDLAPKLFVRGKPEQTLIWVDEETGVLCRAKLDWLRPDGIVDYKTTESASPADAGRSMAKYGYHVQGRFYLRGAQALRLVDEQAWFALAMQEKEPPYLVSVLQPDDPAMQIAELRVRKALLIYRECLETDMWPGYASEIHQASLPPWELRELNEVAS